MVRDFSGGVSRLPQWIEIHNPNAETVNLKGWKFQYATRRFANNPYKIYQLTLAEFRIAGGGTAILATRRLPSRQFSGIEVTGVYDLNIENVLKSGWVLIDATGSEVQRIGRDAFSALSDPVAPKHQNSGRVSHYAYRSESPSEDHYYGHRRDVGSPGFYEQPVPAAPSAPHRKKIGLWGALRKADNKE